MHGKPALLLFYSPLSRLSGVENQDNLKEEKFDGKEDDLSGQIYDQAENFANTTREIVKYVGRGYLNGGDTKRSIK